MDTRKWVRVFLIAWLCLNVFAIVWLAISVILDPHSGLGWSGVVFVFVISIIYWRIFWRPMLREWFGRTR